MPHADFDGWEKLVRKEGCLAVEAMRWLGDTASNGHALGSTHPSQLSREELRMVDEARAALRRHSVAK